MANPRIAEVKTLSCSASWRNYYFVKITTEDGTVGWSEFDEGFGSPGVGAVINQLSLVKIGRRVGISLALGKTIFFHQISIM
jgi:L-alanine-DL-glutamate epimerase-like enolase superfamily enzyme